MIILDTNVVSEPMRRHPDQNVVDWLDAQAPETLYLTTITLAEVRFGIAALPDGFRRNTLHERFEHEFVPLFGERMLPFDMNATTSFSALRSRSRQQGKAIGDFDALIAAIAMSRGYVVATRDTSPFQNAGLVTINPFS
ncbi:MAG: type II toxin-antitoxin system VapC family toxin [Mycobacteriaceae bacterium]|uniref:type II toxin-antitoxin system VapC family toxin n=1 Tax=Corynebacterium sp. TaxID=1720 RepID=UPI003F957E60